VVAGHLATARSMGLQIYRLEEGGSTIALVMELISNHRGGHAAPCREFDDS
jgi:hypothetical protein